jgi:cardiolipin synthase (CMP-forming)
MKSRLGSILDPLSDKFLAAILTGALVYKGLLPYPLAGLIIGRDIGLVLGGLYYRFVSFSPEQVCIQEIENL